MGLELTITQARIRDTNLKTWVSAKERHILTVGRSPLKNSTLGLDQNISNLFLVFPTALYSQPECKQDIEGGQESKEGQGKTNNTL